MLKVDFNPEGHLYTVEGQRKVSVTQALSLVDDRWKDPFFLRRGSIVHKVTELYDLDQLDESTVDDQIQGYFTAYKTFLLDTGFKPRLIEHRMYDPKWQFAGTLDREGDLFKCAAIIDLKSGAPAKVDPLQGAAYWHLYGSPIHKVFDLYLREDGTYKLKEVEKPRNLFPTFCAILTAYRFKEGL
jgi:hypothetical protein